MCGSSLLLLAGVQYEEKVESEHARFERLSETLKKEYEWFERVYSREIKRVVTASLEALIATEQKVPPPP